MLGDFNGDGKLDAAIGSGTSALLLLGNGDGTFQVAPSYSVGIYGSIAAGDFNRDGALDLVTAGGCCIDVLLTPARSKLATGGLVRPKRREGPISSQLPR